MSKFELLNKVNKKIAKVTGRTGLILRKKSPEILLGVGVVGFCGTVVLACKATLRADEILEYHDKKMADIKEAKAIVDEDPENNLEYDERLYRQDVAFQYIRTGGNMLKLYAPSITLGAFSMACILTSANIMKKRYLGAVAAYNAVSGAFETYRTRVREEYGEQMDRHFRYGTEISQIKETVQNEDGKNVKQTTTVENIDLSKVTLDSTAVFFDESNRNWNKNPAFSLMFLRSQQNYLNDILQTRGHVFLNEAYDALGFEHTPEGALLGWIAGEGDDFIDFGLYDQNKEGVRRFVNGKDNVILLEFNHDGAIWDKI